MTKEFLCEQPRLLGAATFLKVANLVRVAQGKSDVVKTVDEAILAEGVDFEVHELAAVRRGYGLRLQVDHEPKARKGSGLVEQPVDLRFGERDRQQAVLAAVVVENVGVGRRDERPEAVLGKRPGGMLAPL